MISKVITIGNDDGLHLRPAGVLVREIKDYSSKVTIITEEKSVNAKSVIAVAAAGIKKNTKVEFVCEGADEVETLARIEELAAANFGE